MNQFQDQFLAASCLQEENSARSVPEVAGGVCDSVNRAYGFAQGASQASGCLSSPISSAPTFHPERQYGEVRESPTLPPPQPGKV